MGFPASWIGIVCMICYIMNIYPIVAIYLVSGPRFPNLTLLVRNCP
jgi:hypothetical protein